MVKAFHPFMAEQEFLALVAKGVTEMAVRRVLTYPDTVLTEEAEAVTNIDGTIQQLINDMADTMYHAPGIGLASNQVGEPLRIIMFDTSAKEEPKDLFVVINPEIVEAEGAVVSEEGCLSVVDYSADVKRARCITVQGLDREGNPITLKREGLPAIVLQHEIDHLNGILFINHISKLKRELYKRRLRKILKKGEPTIRKL
jgi:peptide deformylase